MTTTKALAGVCCILGALFSGCGGDGMTAIRGNVLFDGKPVERGVIRFLAADGKTPTASAAIADGVYAAQIVPGEKHVQIRAFRVVGRRHHRDDPNGPLEDTLQQILPARYNTQSTLICNVQPGQREYDFTLQH